MEEFSTWFTGDLQMYLLVISGKVRQFHELQNEESDYGSGNSLSDGNSVFFNNKNNTGDGGFYGFKDNSTDTDAELVADGQLLVPSIHYDSALEQTIGLLVSARDGRLSVRTIADTWLSMAKSADKFYIAGRRVFQYELDSVMQCLHSWAESNQSNQRNFATSTDATNHNVLACLNGEEDAVFHINEAKDIAKSNAGASTNSSRAPVPAILEELAIAASAFTDRRLSDRFLSSEWEADWEEVNFTAAHEERKHDGPVTTLDNASSSNTITTLDVDVGAFCSWYCSGLVAHIQSLEAARKFDVRGLENIPSSSSYFVNTSAAFLSLKKSKNRGGSNGDGDMFRLLGGDNYAGAEDDVMSARL
jgi:hypothetical protein